MPRQTKITRMTEITDLVAKEIDEALVSLGLSIQDLITRDQLVEGYRAYMNSRTNKPVRDERYRSPGQSFANAITEAPPDKTCLKPQAQC